MYSLRLCVSLLVLLASISSIAQQTDPTAETDFYGVITGLPSDAFCTVELRSVQSLVPVSRATCDLNGSFQFTKVPRGEYEIVLESGTLHYTENVTLFEPRQEIEIRVPQTQTPEAGSSVSVSELKVPDKAKKEVQKASDAMDHSELAKAQDHITRALSIAPNYARAITMQAVLLMEREDYHSALNAANRSASLEPLQPMTQFVRASALNALGHPKQAQLAAEQGLRLGGDSWQGHFEIAKSFYSQQDYTQALQEINRAEQQAPKDFAEFYLVRASVLLNLNQRDEARKDLNRFMKMRPADPRAQKLQAALYPPAK